MATQGNVPARQPLFLPPMPPARLPARQEGVVGEGEEIEEGLVEQEPEGEPESEELEEERKPMFPETELSPEAEEEIFGLSDSDILGGSDDFSDILSVSDEDILGTDPLKKRPKKLKRTVKKYQSPPNPSMGSIQY